MKFMNLTDRFGERVMVNLEHVRYMYELKEGENEFTNIVFDGMNFYVKEKLADINNRIIVNRN